jgi:hypothetical protein
MTQQEQMELDTWLASVREKQPAGTLFVFAYVRDGNWNVPGPPDAKAFPTADIPKVRAAFDTVMDEFFDAETVGTAEAASP